MIWRINNMNKYEKINTNYSDLSIFKLKNE